MKVFMGSRKRLTACAFRRFFRQRLKQVETAGVVGSKEDKWTVADMKERIEADYERRQNRSLKTVKYCFKHIEAASVSPSDRHHDTGCPGLHEETLAGWRGPRIGQPRARLSSPRF